MACIPVHLREGECSILLFLMEEKLRKVCSITGIIYILLLNAKASEIVLLSTCTYVH